MSQVIASLYAEIGAKVDGFTSGASKVKSDLGGLASDVAKTTGVFNGQFKSALLGGKANMDSFGVSLLDQADKAGLSTEQMLKLSGATGIYSQKQLQVAQSSVNVAAKAEELTKAVAKGEMTAEDAGKAFQAYAKSQEVAGLASLSLQQVMSVGIPIILAVASALYQTEKAADAAARSDARLEAVLRSTGEAAGYNFEQLDTMAQGLSKVTGVDDDLIKKSMAVQATFTNISGKVFPEATKAALDLSAVLGGDLQSATIQVDKALNDFDGYTALKRAGVSFSEEQIKQIKNFKATNDIAGYQRLILKELSKEFGGAAQAIHDAGDKSEDVAIAWGNLTENAGGGLVPVLRGVNVYLTESIDGWNRFLTGINNANDGVSRSIKGLTELAVAAGGPITWFAQYVVTQGQAMDAQNRLNASIEQGTNAIDEMGKANLEYVPTAEEVEAANKAISDANIALIGTIESMQSAEESYARKIADLQQDRIDAENALSEAVQNNGDITAEEYNKLAGKIEEIKQKEADLAAERDKQALQYVSNILLQKLEMDGLTNAEFEAFAKQQEAWGLWSADVVQKAQAAWQEADKIAASINNIPLEKTSTITIVHNDVYGQPGGLIGPPKPPGYEGDNNNNDNTPTRWYGGVPQPSMPGQRLSDVLGGGDTIDNYASWWDAPWNQFSKSLSWQQQYLLYGHANGGEFMIPAGYGNEGFRMGNRDTASGGELITITPRNQVNQRQQNFDYERMARAFAVAIRDALVSTGR